MKVAILSGKGGTGKTLLSVNLAAVASQSIYIDCDVEEPNGHIFFKPENIREEEITIKIPQISEELCKGCRKCINFCRFNALAYIAKKVIVFDEVCHSCGGCSLVCPNGAISEVDCPIGKIQIGQSDNVQVNTGILDIGVATGVPIINKLLDTSNKDSPNTLTLIDCPPGSSCNVMESIADADYCILVAEPTIFGVHNLKMVYNLLKLLDKKFAVVINKCLEEENIIDEFCRCNKIKILDRIHIDDKLGKLNSSGKIVSRECTKYNNMFTSLLEKIEKEANK